MITISHPQSLSSRRTGAFLRCALFLGIIGVLCACAPAPANLSTLNQVAIFSSLNNGNYDGELSYGKLEQYGDFGLGTFDNLDGEMVALDGVFYQAKADGSVQPAADTLEVPFADVHFFAPSSTSELVAPVADYAGLKKTLDGLRSKPNNIYAFRIKGTFPHIKVRSVHAQQQPYPPLSEAVAKQVEFDLENIPGTLVGYWMPDYLVNMGVPGYHLHFISDDRKHGGHVLEVSLDKASIEVDQLENMIFILPQNEAFHGMDLKVKPDENTE